MLEKGDFREDLYYRLNVFSLSLPPLRDHLEDLPELAEHFLRMNAIKEARPGLHLNKDAIKLLMDYPWKGNVRELRNVLERAGILTDGNEILPEHLPYAIQKQDKTLSGNLSLSMVEKNHIERVLQHTHGNKTKAAESLGIGLTTLYRKMEEYQLSK
jgi:DNA-binding NtrC family response regulator